ncbi:Hypothetical Protein FCC1311_008552 [Hondaea fermentalgiana]|uniref:Uncharacterized protein n=1 Tax=Hondaea fermentalgiana TaxID=2315210 RepID=A0A2R5G0U2_9STRA|nr:Hypothetical Protein FCC1311_008552 [Hondaea fermentalgiana]|eukprot:GBG24636.1 Hypothetical Protein FCC1311_008552 [Hondaea fermentalgiana]
MWQAVWAVEKMPALPVRSALYLRTERKRAEYGEKGENSVYADAHRIRLRVSEELMDEVDHEVVHTEFVRALFSSWVFAPERMLLGLVRRITSYDIPDATVKDIRACDFDDYPADKETYDFDHDGVAMFRLMERNDSPKECESLFSWNPKSLGLTWFATARRPDGYDLYFGSGIEVTDAFYFNLAKQFHICYARLLLAGAAAQIQHDHPAITILDD